MRLKVKPLHWLVIILLSIPGLAFFAPVEKLSLTMVSRTLKNNKSISAKAELFYQTNSGVMVTHFTSPFEFLVITNNKGEMKMYDPKENSVSHKMDSEMSSENSFLYQFLNGSMQDMGLKKSGFKVKSSKMDGSIVITEFTPPEAAREKIGKVELAHERFKPVFMGFFDKENRPLQKVYYSSYTQVEHYTLPLSITEIAYVYAKDKKDSIITKRVYSDLKLNNSVNNQWLSFKIPANAKVIE